MYPANDLPSVPPEERPPHAPGYAQWPAGNSPPAAAPHAAQAATNQPPRRKRPKPGERRVQILQILSSMLAQPTPERVTTAVLAARLGVSEAGLYRHFASKAQMLEALIESIEDSVLGQIRQISADKAGPRADRIVTAVLEYGERNPGMARVMAGDALVGEHERLQQRMTQFFNKLEAALLQGLRDEAPLASDFNAQLKASILSAYIAGRLQHYARSGFQHRPTELLEPSLRKILLA
ncbi:MAG: nucleoid occlusion factor SlmA [Burkholderiaceae bacterium]|jgi:TetR/AcrR family transcriptional regulator|nr:nucleoid occlusion factor SlmA [Burkholderiaceae bacterium]